MLGWKTIETRTHGRFSGLAGKRIGIHASVRWDKDALEQAKPWLTYDQFERSSNFLKIGGCIMGTVGVSTHRRMNTWDSKYALVECITERYGLVLYDPQVIEAIPAKGRQGIWYFDEVRAAQKGK